jgi:hypothetical protein
MFSQPLVITSNRSKVNVSYNADLVIDDNGMSVEQLIQTNKGMKLFESDPKKVKLTRKTIDSQLESEDITNEMNFIAQNNNFGQYIRIKSHYKFDENNTDSKSHSSNKPEKPNSSSKQTKQKSTDEHKQNQIQEVFINLFN